MRQLRPFVAFSALAIAAACQDAGTAVRPEKAEIKAQPEGFATRGPIEQGWIIGRDGQPMEITYEVQNGMAIWEGDIDLGPVEWISRTAEEARTRKKDGPRLGVA
ncbi:MAG TPA: hypothetical protein VEQ60_01500, partial [Longimicrobium sp.]|nr:hypothetical protein [Longimicrobium sp.]